MITITVTLSSKSLPKSEMIGLMDIVVDDLRHLECSEKGDVKVKAFWRDYGASGKTATSEGVDG